MFKKVKENFNILDLNSKESDRFKEEPASATAEEEAMKFLDENRTKKSNNFNQREEKQGRASDSVTNHNPRMKIYKPTYYEVAHEIGADILDGKIVLLDLGDLDKETSVKIMQFVSGVCFALKIVPEDVNKSGRIYSFDPQFKN